jgi:hypothetical protein
MMFCSYCGDLTDTDDGEGEWDVQKVNSTKRYEFVCGCRREKYINEDGQLDPDLEEKLEEERKREIAQRGYHGTDSDYDRAHAELIRLGFTAVDAEYAILSAGW